MLPTRSTSAPRTIKRSPKLMHDFFRRFAGIVSRVVGSGWTLIFVILVIVGTGFYSGFGESWKDATDFGAKLTVLFLVFLLQKSQNHSDKATHLKLDELIKASEGARNEIAAAEHQAERKMDGLKQDS